MCEKNWKIDHVIKDIQKQTLFIKYTIQLVEHEKHSISQLRRSFKNAPISLTLKNSTHE